MTFLVDSSMVALMEQNSNQTLIDMENIPKSLELPDTNYDKMDTYLDTSFYLII